MQLRSPSCLMHSSILALLCALLFISHSSSSLTEESVIFILDGKRLNDPHLNSLQVPVKIVNFDEQEFSADEVKDLLTYLRLHRNSISPGHPIDEQKYSLLLLFAESLNSKALFEFVARDFFHLLGTSVVYLFHNILGMRSANFEPILFKTYMELSSNLSLAERLRIFLSLMKSVRPDFDAFKEFFSGIFYKVVEVNISEDSNATNWTLNIVGSHYSTFFIGNHDSDDWHLKFVSGNPPLSLW